MGWDCATLSDPQPPVPSPLWPPPGALQPAGRPRGTGEPGLDSSCFDLRAPVPSSWPIAPRAANSLHVGVCRAHSPTCPKLFPNLERAGKKRGAGEGRGIQTASQSFPFERLKSVHVLKKNGTNLRIQLRGHVPPAPHLLCSLLCAPAVSSQQWLPGPPASALPLVEALLEAPSD